MNNKINVPFVAVDREKYKSEEELWKAIASVCKVLLEKSTFINIRRSWYLSYRLRTRSTV